MHDLVAVGQGLGVLGGEGLAAEAVELAGVGNHGDFAEFGDELVALGIRQLAPVTAHHRLRDQRHVEAGIDHRLQMLDTALAAVFLTVLHVVQQGGMDAVDHIRRRAGGKRGGHAENQPEKKRQ